MKTSERRAEERFAVTQRATIRTPSAWVPVLIEDLSSTGFLLMCAVKVHVGDTLALKSELYPERFLQCKVCVRHLNGDSLGTNIIEISDADLVLCHQFIGEHISLKRFRYR